MNLVEAVDYVQTTLNVSSVFAQVLLKHAIGSRQIPAKWADQESARDLINIRELARSRLVMLPPGYGIDAESFRPLLLRRATVEGAAQLGGAATFRNSSQVYPFKAGPWMNLIEAVEYIQIVDELEFLDALAQLKAEIGNGIVGVQWNDQEDPQDFPDPNYLAKSQLLPIGPGFARDVGHAMEQYRRLLARTSDLQRLWPSLKEPTKVSPPSLDSKGGRGRPTVRELVRSTLEKMKDEQWSMNQLQITIATEVLRRNRKSFDDRGWSDRTVLRHLSKWLTEAGYSPPVKRKSRK